MEKQVISDILDAVSAYVRGNINFEVMLRLVRYAVSEEVTKNEYAKINKSR